MRVVEGHVFMTEKELKGLPEEIQMAGERMVRAYQYTVEGRVIGALHEVYVSFCEGSDNRRKAKFTKYLKSLGAHMVYAEKHKMTGRAAITFGAMRVKTQFGI